MRYTVKMIPQGVWSFQENFYNNKKYCRCRPACWGYLHAALQDISEGQIRPSVGILHVFDFDVPVWVLDWTMELLPGKSWRRKSSISGMPMNTEEYIMRNVITGAGIPGSFYGPWLLSTAGRPFLFIESKQETQWQDKNWHTVALKCPQELAGS